VIQEHREAFGVISVEITPQIDADVIHRIGQVLHDSGEASPAVLERPFPVVVLRRAVHGDFHAQKTQFLELVYYSRCKKGPVGGNSETELEAVLLAEGPQAGGHGPDRPRVEQGLAAVKAHGERFASEPDRLLAYKGDGFAGRFFGHEDRRLHPLLHAVGAGEVAGVSGEEDNLHVGGIGADPAKPLLDDPGVLPLVRHQEASPAELLHRLIDPRSSTVGREPFHAPLELVVYDHNSLGPGAEEEVFASFGKIIDEECVSRSLHFSGTP
jgi:hypothetical protein